MDGKDELTPGGSLADIEREPETAKRHIAIAGVRSTHTEGALEPSVDLLPFFGDGKIGESGVVQDITFPGDFPFDRQIVIRLPKDLRKRVNDGLRQSEMRQREGHNRTLNLRFRIEAASSTPPGEPTGRRFVVTLFDESLNATLVDLPTISETHIQIEAKSNSTVADQLFKSGDVTQLMLVHRGKDPHGADHFLDKATFKWAHGLTPPTRSIRKRKFMQVPGQDSEFSHAKLCEAMRAVRDRMNNDPYEYEELGEVDTDMYKEICRKHPDLIWTPPPSALKAMRAKAASSAGGKSSALKRNASANSVLSTASARSAGSEGRPKVSGGGGGGAPSRSPPGRSPGAGSGVSASPNAGAPSDKRKLRLS